MKNIFVPINTIPYEVLSTIPDYWVDGDPMDNNTADYGMAANNTADRNLITLTHVCHNWRELFISRPSLWTNLDCTNVEKTRVYIERSKSCLLKVCVPLG